MSNDSDDVYPCPERFTDPQFESYETVITRVRPKWVIETGTMRGENAIFTAERMDYRKIDNGRIISVDSAPASSWPQHPRITYLAGRSTTDQQVLDAIESMIGDDEHVVVLIDPRQNFDHTYSELVAYRPFVTPLSYLICASKEDARDRSDALAAIETFLTVCPEFSPGFDNWEGFLSNDVLPLF